jgi:hypothetical protein
MSKKTFGQAGYTTLDLNTAVNYNSETTQKYREGHDGHITVIWDYMYDTRTIMGHAGYEQFIQEQQGTI